MRMRNASFLARPQHLKFDASTRFTPPNSRRLRRPRRLQNESHWYFSARAALQRPAGVSRTRRGKGSQVITGGVDRRGEILVLPRER